MDSIERFEKLDEAKYLLDANIRPALVEQEEHKTIINWDDADEELDQFLNEDDSESDSNNNSPSETKSPTSGSNNDGQDSNSDSSDDDWLKNEIENALQTIPQAPLATLKRKQRDE